MHTNTNAGETPTAEPLPENDTDPPNRPRSSKAATACAWLAPLAVLLLSAARAIAGSYPLELLCHFQFQYFIASLVILLLLLTLRRPRAAILAGAALIVSGAALAPLWFTSPNSARADAEPTKAFRILHANVLSSNQQTAPLFDLIAREQPDLLALHEVNARWIDALAGLADDYPYRDGAQREDDFGILVLSRTPLQEAAVRHFGSSRVPSVTFQIRVHDVTVQVVATHTMPPMSAAAQSARDEHLTRMTDFAKARSEPLIIVGDLNTTMWAPSHRRLCDELGLTNTRQGFGVLPSWPALFPALMRLPIDHCLVGDGITVLDCRLGPDIGSDHLPMIIDLAVGGD